MNLKIMVLLTTLLMFSKTHAFDGYPVKCVDQDDVYGITVGYKDHFPIYEGHLMELAYGKLGRAHESQIYKVVQATHLRASSTLILQKTKAKTENTQSFPEFFILTQNIFEHDGKWVFNSTGVLDCSL